MYHYIVLSLGDDPQYFTSVTKNDLKRQQFIESPGYELVDDANEAGKERAIQEKLKPGEYKVIVVWDGEAHSRM